MMRRLLLITGTCAALGMIAACTNTQETLSPKRTGLQHFHGAKPTPIAGIPAVPVKTPGQTPAFSQDDVRAYVQSHALPGSLAKLSRVDAVQLVSFMRADQASQMLDNEPTETEPDRAVCVVIETGDFAIPMPDRRVMHYPVAAEVFDARTGNFLMSAGLAKAPAANDNATAR
jgi:hypothetical protein